MLTLQALHAFLVFAAASTASTAASPTPAAKAAEIAPFEVSVRVSNPTSGARSRETIAVSIAELGKLVAGFDAKKAVVVNVDGKPMLSQLVDSDGDESPDQLVFQADFAGKESKSFRVRSGERQLASKDEYKAYGRFVRERHDDFAWENDLVAHRMYGPDLETCKKEPLTSSGIDVWVKRVPKLVVNEWYMTDDYHQDRGEGADFYAVGKSRGCGGLGIWQNGKLSVSKNFTQSRVLANGPVRLVFELTYAPWETGDGRMVAESKRVVLDAGSRFNRFESMFTGATGGLSAGIGISIHPGSTVKTDNRHTAMRVWEPLDNGKAGNLGTAIVLPKGSKMAQQTTESDYLVIAPVPSNGRLVYFIGTAWDRAEGVADSVAWAKEVESFGNRIAAPMKIELSVAKPR